MSKQSHASYYMGLDFSTQQIKAIITNNELAIIHEEGVQFETELPEFGTDGGVHKHDDGITVTAPTLMFVKALDLLLEKLKSQGVQLSKVAAISGAGQQHGSVYWKFGSAEPLQQLDPNRTLYDQLQNSFSKPESPIWMDTSTDAQCKQLEDAAGSPLKLAELTGSRGFHRFTGPQIAKIFQSEPDVYAQTERISLISSFACSLLMGDYAPIDWSDGSGMNLMNIRTHKWEQTCLDACAPGLKPKLGSLVPSPSVVGKISQYFVKRYNFPSECQMVAFTGDNPSSLAGINLAQGDVAISWGTSDTVFVWLQDPEAALDMHVLANPVAPDAYMGMLCFKNGAFSRDRIRRESSCDTWDDFNQLLNQTNAGNDGNIGFYYDFPEILPNLTAGDHRFDKSGEKVECFGKSVEARALIEHQCLAKLVHAEALGYSRGGKGKVIVTGGASVNATMMQILANVFATDVYVQHVANSAALGGSYRAKHGTLGGGFSALCSKSAEFLLMATPQSHNIAVYEKMAQRYKDLEATLT